MGNPEGKADCCSEIFLSVTLGGVGFVAHGIVSRLLFNSTTVFCHLDRFGD